MQNLTLTLSLLRLYSVLPASNASSSIPTGQRAIMPLAVGLTFGFLTLAIAVLGAFYLRRRRREKSALLDAGTTPLSPPAQGDQRSGAPRDRKLPPQQLTDRSTLSSSAIGVTESEMPPSYESHVVTARVARLNN